MESVYKNMVFFHMRDNLIPYGPHTKESYTKGITAFKGIWGGKSAVLRSEISFYSDASAEA